MPPTCIRCRRDTSDPEGEDVVLRLDGAPMLAALHAARREDLTDAQREVIDRIAAGLCPTCGRDLG